MRTLSRLNHLLLLALWCTIAASVSVASGDPAVSRAIGAIFGEDHIVESAYGVHQRSLAMSPQDRYQFLSDWVLPHDSHDAIRVLVDFMPTHPAGNDGGEGGNLVSPALDLVRSAAEIDRLAELSAKVEMLSPTSTLGQKNRIALLVLIAIQKNQSDVGLKLIDEFLKLSAATELDDVRHRSAEALLFHVGRSVPDIYEALVGPVSTIARRKMTKNVWPIWNRQFQTLATELHLPDPEPAINRSASGQWMSAGIVDAESRGAGIPASRWRLQKGQADNTISHDDDVLYFQSPLTGNFQVECDFAAFSWRDSQLVVCGTWVAPVYTQQHFEVGDIRGTSKRHLLEPRFSKIRGTVHNRVTVTDGQTTAFVNGRRVHDWTMLEHHDPWIAIRNDFKHGGSAFNVRITGAPVIPEAITLTAHPQLQGWLSYFPGSVGWSHSHWQPLYLGQREDRTPANIKQSGGIFAPRRAELPTDCFCEEALFYHRPMLEDGTIEYEYFYNEGQQDAHPMLDRMCFLLQPDGVKLHWLTDGIFDRTDLAPDNKMSTEHAVTEASEDAAADAASFRYDVPRNNAWNKVRLTLTGDIVEIWLNGSVVARQKLNANNQRRFGLFHYADQSELRVRNVTWKGDWPKELPSISDQDLATDEALFLDRDVEHMQAVFQHDFTTDGAVNDRFRLIRGAPGEHVKDTSSGTLALRPGTKGYVNTTIAPSLQAYGDFDITVSYEDFKYSTTENGSSSLLLIARLDNATSDEFFVTRRHMHEPNGERDMLQCVVVQQAPEGERRDYFVTESIEERGGRLRLARRGDRIYYLTAERDSPNFRLRGSRLVTTKPIKADGIRLVAQMHRPGHCSVIWKDIVVKAEKITQASTADADPRVTQLNSERTELLQHVLYDFTKEAPNRAFLYRWRDTRDWNATDKGLKLSAPGFDSWESSGLSTLHDITGDFDITTEFETIKLDKPAADEQTAIYLQIEVPDKNQTQANAMFNLTESGYTEARAQFRYAKPDGRLDYRNAGSVSAKAVTSLRVARRGRKFTVLTKLAGAEHERILDVADLSDVAIPSVRIMLHTGGADRESEILVKRLDIHAEHYEPPPATPTLPPKPVEPPARKKGFFESLFGS
ncbi:DUF1583 domain-containing protein [Fuerstiella marisgermanici]|uniref:3-keto-disaccharide hydrolase domain-containing protein n=1 Tax=Fuerstiella marisgermanici TaxID=1891926 RepID=A0A1P8WFY0_9PLAN|nr:DUF1583 domain-containing protein [Fuerstiella marisgermanici]APZ92953.1 hypothetical protein Fuma_02565 [Fuerstiella marisgermanici]